MKDQVVTLEDFYCSRSKAYEICLKSNLKS